MTEKKTSPTAPAPTPLLIYQTEDGRMRIAAQVQADTLWLTQQQMAQLFQTTQQNISLHLQNVYDEGELQPEATHMDFLLVRQEGSRQVSRQTRHYNLDAVLNVCVRRTLWKANLTGRWRPCLWPVIRAFTPKLPNKKPNSHRKK